MSNKLLDFDNARAVDGTLLRSLLGYELEGYKLLEPISSNKRTIVIKGISSRSGDYVAAKFLSEYACKKRPALLKQFRLEAMVHRNLESKRVAPYRRFVKNKCCLITTYLCGDTLEHFSNQGKKWLLSAIYLICDPIQELHEMGYVHCDLKPNNLIIANRKIRLLDFGSVCPIGAQDDGSMSTKHILGTPGFVSPEQINKLGQYGPPTDIFSLACTLLSLLTGRQYLSPNSSAITAYIKSVWAAGR